MPTTRIQDYMRGKHATPTPDTLARVADGLRIPGRRFGLSARPWELATRAERPPQPALPPTPTPEADTPPLGIGELIRTLRHQRGLSQDDFADALNEALPEGAITRTEVSRYESETRIPIADRIFEALSTVLGTPEPVLRAATRRSWVERRQHLHGPQQPSWQRQSPSHRPNDHIRERRHARGWTQQEAADAVAQVVADATGTTPTGINAAWIGRLERGALRWPSAHYRTALRTVYGAATDDELGLIGLRTKPDSLSEPHDTAESSPDTLRLLPTPATMVHLGTEEAEDMHRRELLRTALTASALSITPPLTALMAAAHESAAFGQRAGMTNVHPGTLEQIDADIERIGRAYLTQPLTELIIEMRLVRNMVFTALEGRQYPSQARQLYLSAAQLCGLMGSAASDLGHYDVARTHARTAAICAELAGHPSVMAWIAATQSLIEFWDHNPAEALRRAQAGHDFVTSDVDALRLYSLAARANARLGDLTNARQAIYQMTIIMDRTDTSTHQSIFDFPAANAFRCAGSSYLWLGQFTDAQTSLSRALEIFESQPEGGSYAHVAVTRIDLALAQLGNNDFDAANETLRPVLELSPHRRLSGMVRRFRDLRAALAQPPYDRLPAAHDLTDHLNALTS
jgi:transcriptional regulator with XRE-family HTH domain/tetratricopeptide (TPR) repeat protein